jgi:hypothetical protein
MPAGLPYRQKKGRMKRKGARNGMMMSDPPQVKTDIIMAANEMEVNLAEARVERMLRVIVIGAEHS